MFRVALLVACFACANAFILPEVKIVGGTLATIDEAPYQVALLYDFSNTGSYNQACGGVIVGRTAILTAAQCVVGSLPSQWRIRAGSSFHNSGGEVIQVTVFRVIDQYNPTTLANDLAILFLANSITLGTTSLIATLPAQALDVADNTPCFLTGWGRLTAGGVTPTQLYKATVPIVNQAQCESAYYGYNTLTSNMLCAGRLGIGGIDACQGDTGGPLMYSNILIGLTSWGRGCGEPQYPGVYTKVSMYRNWIESNL